MKTNSSNQNLNAVLICFSWGLDLQKNCIANCKELGIFEPLMSKIKSLKFATEAAITILRIDDLIKLREEKPVDENDR